MSQRLSIPSKRKAGLAELSPNTPTRPSKKAKHTPSEKGTPTPTPKHSTNFKVYGNNIQRTSGVHKTRCPCTQLKELEKQKTETKDKALIKELQNRIDELKQNGCTGHGQEYLLTREQIQRNKAKVEEQTPYGRQRRIREFVGSENNARRALEDEEGTARSGLCQLAYHSRVHISGMYSDRLALQDIESAARYELEASFGRSHIQEYFVSGLLQAVQSEEGRLRYGVLNSQDSTRALLLAPLQLCVCEYSARWGIVSEYHHNTALCVQQFRNAVYGTLVADEAARRDVVINKEITLRTDLASAICADFTLTQQVVQVESAQRRQLNAEASYCLEDTLAELSAGLPAALFASESRARELLISQRCESITALFNEEVAERHTLLYFAARSKFGSELWLEYFTFLYSSKNEFRREQRATIEKYECSGREAIFAEEQTNLAMLSHSFGMEWPLIQLSDWERHQRQLGVQEEEDRLQGLYNEYRLSQLNAVENECFRIAQIGFSEEEHARRQIRSLFLMNAAEAILRGSEATNRRNIEAEYFRELCQGYEMKYSDAFCATEASEASARQLILHEEQHCTVALATRVVIFKAELALLTCMHHESNHRLKLLEEEEKTRTALFKAMEAAMLLLLTDLEGFRAAKQYLNTREVILGLQQWEIDEDKELCCAANCYMVSLMRHAAALTAAYDEQIHRMSSRHDNDLARCQQELTSTKSQLYQAKEKVEDLDTQLRAVLSRQAKLVTAHQALTKKNEDMVRESRSTSAANEKARLENKVKDLTRQLDRAMSALDKERNRRVRC